MNAASSIWEIGQAGKIQMGVEFTEACPSFWQIDFPPDDWVVPES